MASFSQQFGWRWSLPRWPASGWTLTVGAIALLLSMPVLVVLGSLLTPASDVWAHLASTVLPRYLLNSLGLTIGVGSGVVIVGVGTAWLVTMCQFPGSRLLEWALLLPLAAPAYILAYVYTEVLEFYGPVQSGLRSLFGWRSLADYWFPNVRSLWGAALMLILVLYPYVYMLARVAFLEQAVCTLEASRSLGCGPWRSFRKVALPLARPAIATGTALVLMETLSDFGTVQYFGVDTFTTGIYRTWFGLGDRVAASQLAAALLVAIALLIAAERWSRRQARYYQAVGRYQPIQPYALRGWRSAVAMVACIVPISLGFVIPAGMLVYMTVEAYKPSQIDRLWAIAGNSLTLAGITAALGVAIALVMAYGVRLYPNRAMALFVRLASMGYAVPGSVIAVGILIPMGRFDNALDAWMRATFNISTGLLFSGTLVALIGAYLVRFLAISLGTVESSLGRIKPSLDDASRSLGQTTTGTLAKVHLPLLSGGLLTAAILVFVDVMKELPATLIIRPFNVETLAVRVYQMAADERLTEAAAPALGIVLVGLIPVALLSWQIRRGTPTASVQQTQQNGAIASAP